MDERRRRVVEPLNVVDEHRDLVVSGASSERGEYEPGKVALLVEVDNAEQWSERNLGGRLRSDDLDHIHVVPLENLLGLFEQTGLPNACRPSKEQPAAVRHRRFDGAQFAITTNQPRCLYRHNPPALDLSVHCTKSDHWRNVAR